MVTWEDTSTPCLRAARVLVFAATWLLDLIKE